MSARLIRSTLAVLAAIALVGCQRGERSEEAAAPEAAADTASAGGAVQVVARDFQFEIPDSIPSGWTTFRFSNEGQETHFFLLTLLPEGKTIEDYVQEVGPPFGTVMDSLRAGTMDKAAAGAYLGSHLPDWYLTSTKYMGGVGLTAPGETSQATVKLVPGTYEMECYVKAPNGQFHGMLGMIRALTVTSAESETAEPTADLEATLHNGRIEAPDSIAAGRHTIAVHYAEQPAAGLGNDLHLVRLDDQANLDDIERWMDWMEVGGLMAPAPAEFLGGVEEMPAGDTAYFTVNVPPGRYAWISERPAEQPMAKEVVAR